MSAFPLHDHTFAVPFAVDRSTRGGDDELLLNITTQVGYLTQHNTASNQEECYSRDVEHRIHLLLGSSLDFSLVTFLSCYCCPKCISVQLISLLK